MSEEKTKVEVMEEDNGTAQPEEGKITIRLGRETYVGNYIEDLSIDEQNLNTALIEQPTRYVFWALMTARAKIILYQWKQELDRYEAQMYTYIRSAKAAEGEKFTEKLLDAEVELDEKTKELKKKVLKAQLQHDHLSAVRGAFEMRSQMLMSLGANLREEWGTQLAIKEKTLMEQRLQGQAKKPARSKKEE